jgi:hypothetical protein
LGNRSIDLLLDREVLGVQVNEGDFHIWKAKRLKY